MPSLQGRDALAPRARCPCYLSSRSRCAGSSLYGNDTVFAIESRVPISFPTPLSESMYQRLSLIFALLAMLAACGQKGSLYYPVSSPDSKKSTPR
ncbi:MAG: LPS translocon maturation chaperone LptM [Methylococcaceae bacterium]